MEPRSLPSGDPVIDDNLDEPIEVVFADDTTPVNAVPAAAPDKPAPDAQSEKQ